MARDTIQEKTTRTNFQPSGAPQSEQGAHRQTPQAQENQPQKHQTQEHQAQEHQAQEHQRQGQTQDRTQGGTGLARRGGATPTHGGAQHYAHPFALMQRMAEDMDRLFEQFGFGRTGFGLTPFAGAGVGRDLWGASDREAASLWSPQVEMFRRGDELVVRADLPGMRKDDLHVDVENDVLTIRGERRDEREETGDGFYRSERRYGEFYRAIPLPEGVNAEQCEASYADGVLEITLPAPKPEARQAKRIPVR